MSLLAKQEACQTCGKKFLVDDNDTPEFCPFCKSDKLYLTGTHILQVDETPKK